MGEIPRAQTPAEQRMTFSFRRFTSTQKFTHQKCKDSTAYLNQLLERMKAVSGMETGPFRASGGSALRSHQIKFEETSERNGFGFAIPEGCSPWQFSLSSNEYGRVHGYIIRNVFYVVWLDPEHALYPQR
jgi:hypothetical protein